MEEDHPKLGVLSIALIDAGNLEYPFYQVDADIAPMRIRHAHA
jgi:hypothetical protein